MRILVADDQGFWRRALEESLLERGYRVTCVESADQALQVLSTESDVALLVTDWVMPGLSGPELCRRVRESDRDRYLPIILLTSRSGRENLVEALDAGADAFVQKPFDAPELLAQVRVAQRILALETRLAQRIEELDAARQRIESDLTQAAEIQRSFLPAAPPMLPGFEFAWHFETCQRLGGDLFNVVRLSDDQVGLHVLDVSGHGTSAALHSVSLSHVLHPLPQQGGILKRRSGDGAGTEVRSPAEVASELNRRFPLIERSGHYATFLYGILDLSSLLFRYVRAGHPGPVHVTAAGAIPRDDGGGVPIGVTPGVDYRDQEIQLSPGDSLVLFTDGVLETRNEDDEDFGIERMLEVLSQPQTSGAEGLVSTLRSRLDEFRKLEPVRDDVTVVALHARS